MSYPPPNTLASPPPPPPPPKTAAPQTQSHHAYATSPPYQSTHAPPVPPPPHAVSELASTPSGYARSPPPGASFAGGPPLPEDGWVPDVLRGMNKTDLQHLLDTPSLLAALLHAPAHAHPSLAHADSALAAALERTAGLAAQAAAAERALAAHRERTAQHLGTARALEQAWRRREGEMEGALAGFAPRALHTRLVLSIGEQEEVCRAVEEGWVEEGEGVASEKEVVDWVRRVREGRRLLEMRRERRARWDEGRVGGWR